MVKSKSSSKIRPISKSDFPQILQIEFDSFDDPISENEYRGFLLKNQSAADVFEYDGQILGYVFYSYYLKYIQVYTIAVKEKFRRKGIGKQLIDYLKYKLEPGVYNFIRADLPEDCLAGQLFLKKCGFFCTEIRKYQPPEEGEFYMLQYFHQEDNGQ